MGAYSRGVEEGMNSREEWGIFGGWHRCSVSSWLWFHRFIQFSAFIRRQSLKRCRVMYVNNSWVNLVRKTLKFSLQFVQSMSWSFISIFSPKSFIVLVLVFRSMIHFELIFVYSMKKVSNSILLHAAIQLSHLGN